jgi:triphosphoribosyl-dephospho-CoA synthase
MPLDKLLCNFLHKVYLSSTHNDMRKKEPFLQMKETPQYVSKCLQLALLLEVSAYPKPGNVHRTADFKGTRYEHFLASAVALSPYFMRCAKSGVAVHDETLRLEEIGIGKAVKEAVNDVALWQHGGNTVLGSTILLMPMAAATGITLAEGNFSINRLRRHIKSVVESTTPDDAVNLYEAISTVNPGGLGNAPELDVTEASSITKIKRGKVSLFQVFKISAPWDSISSEWVNNYHITFDIGFPFVTQQLGETGDINVATVHTFLKILSEVPDTLIARKAGKQKAEKVSSQAKGVLEKGGLTTQVGKESLLRFDKQLRTATHKLNPGTIADITSAVLAVVILNGYRP